MDSDGDGDGDDAHASARRSFAALAMAETASVRDDASPPSSDRRPHPHDPFAPPSSLFGSGGSQASGRVNANAMLRDAQLHRRLVSSEQPPPPPPPLSPLSPSAAAPPMAQDDSHYRDINAVLREAHHSARERRAAMAADTAGGARGDIADIAD